MRYLMVMLIVLLVFGCNQQEGVAPANGDAAQPVHGDTFVQASIGEPSTLLPVVASDSASSDINGLVYNGLIKYNKDLILEGELAESWEVSEDNLTFTFHLRKDVTWHDGTPFTSADALFTYQLYTDPDVPTSYAEAYKQVASADAPDPYTFIVTYDKPYAPALGRWAGPIHPKHLLEGIPGAEIPKSPLARSPIGTGPYKFVKWVTGQHVILEANPDYFEGEPYLQRVIYRIIPDQATMFLELKAGNIDLMGLTPIQYTTQSDAKLFKRRFNKYSYLTDSYTYLGYNFQKPIFQDVRVRQALSYAIDKEEIIDGVLLGLGQSATGPYKPGTWVYNPEVRRYGYDPQKARDLLSEAGWADSDGDGILDREGQPFAFTIVTNQGNSLRAQTGEIIQRRLKEVGIEVNLRVIEWATFLKEFIFPGNFDATILGWTGGPEPDQYNIWHSSKIEPRELNFIKYNNAEVDELLEKGRRTFDQAERKEYYDRIQVILAEEQPYTFLYYGKALPVVAKRFRGIESAPSGIMHNFIEWYVPKSEQKYTR